MISITDELGHVRYLGNLEPPQGLVKAWPVYGDTTTTRIIPRSEWDGLIAQYAPGPDHPFLPYVHDQDGIGQCNADATTALAEFTRTVQGLPFVKLSAADLYDRINGGRDQGSLLEDAMSEMLRAGVGTAETSGLLWRRGMRRADESERERYRALEIYKCPTFDHCFSAILQGCGIVTGIMWYPNYNPDSDGWLPRGRGSPGGHAIFGYKPAKRGGEYGIWHLNSWGERFGKNGRFVIPESCYTRDVGGWWSLRVMTDEGAAVPPLSS